MKNKSVEFHIKGNDYFGTLAAILSLIRQGFKKEEFEKLNIATFKKVDKDLMYL